MYVTVDENLCVRVLSHPPPARAGTKRYIKETE